MLSESRQESCAHPCDARASAVTCARSLGGGGSALSTGWYSNSFRHEAVELCRIVRNCSYESTCLAAITSPKFPTRGCEENLTSRVRNLSHRVVDSKPASFRISDLGVVSI